MTRSSQQTYIQRLGFQDKDRANPRHGLACEYLLERIIKRDCIDTLQEKIISAVCHEKKRVTEKIKAIEESLLYARKFGNNSEWAVEKILEGSQEIARFNAQIELLDLAQQIDNAAIQKIIKSIQAKIAPSDHMNVPVRSGNYVNGFADILFQSYVSVNACINENTLKIDDSIVHGGRHGVLGEVKITPEPAENIIQQIAFYRTFVNVDEVIILVDYDAPQLKRMTQGSDIKVYRLGAAFEKWCTERPQPELEEF